MQKFHASKKRFESFDLNYCGSGIGQNRYAFGVYLGSNEAASKYLSIINEGSDLEVDITLVVNGKHVKPATPMFKALMEIQAGVEVEQVLQKYPSLEAHLQEALPDVQATKGVMYQVNIPRSVSDNIVHWHDSVDSEDMIRIFSDLLDNYNYETEKFECVERLNCTCDFIEKVGEVNHEMPVSQMLDKCVTFLHGYASNSEDSAPGEVEIKEYLWAHLMYDQEVLNELEESVGDYLHMDVLEALQKLEIPSLVRSLNPTHEGLYSSLVEVIKENQSCSHQKAMEMTSELVSGCLGIDGYEAPDIYSEGKDTELVLVSKQSLRKIAISEVLDHSPLLAEELTP